MAPHDGNTAMKEKGIDTVTISIFPAFVKRRGLGKRTTCLMCVCVVQMDENIGIQHLPLLGTFQDVISVATRVNRFSAPRAIDNEEVLRISTLKWITILEFPPLKADTEKQLEDRADAVAPRLRSTKPSIPIVLETMRAVESIRSWSKQLPKRLKRRSQA
eukprot:GHVP01040842.1.p1 GENE.GHVP01040842.1~~GHVP01040842.1.p1  ORF type:complete len:160 (+),score=17.47 GHVP01040842.1:618-1097(+)